MQQQTEIVAPGAMFQYFPGLDSEDMDLLLPKAPARRRYALKFSDVPPRHGGLHHHAVVLGNSFEIFEAEIGECGSQPGAGGEESVRDL